MLRTAGGNIEARTGERAPRIDAARPSRQVIVSPLSSNAAVGGSHPVPSVTRNVQLAPGLGSRAMRRTAG